MRGTIDKALTMGSPTKTAILATPIKAQFEKFYPITHYSLNLPPSSNCGFSRSSRPPFATTRTHPRMPFSLCFFGRAMLMEPPAGKVLSRAKTKNVGGVTLGVNLSGHPVRRFKHASVAGLAWRSAQTGPEADRRALVLPGDCSASEGHSRRRRDRHHKSKAPRLGLRAPPLATNKIFHLGH